MGLINWFKDKVVMSMEHDIRLIKAEMQGYQMQIEQLKSQIISLRQKKYQQQEENISPQASLDEIQRAFGGQLPIELAEKYKRD